MQEYDLMMMSLLIFLPSAFGLLLLLIPRKFEEPIKWFALFGAAFTLMLSLFLLIDYYSLLDSKLDPNGRPMQSPEGTLEWRAMEAHIAAAKDVPGPRLSRDWVARYKWIEHYDINYALGIDGISLPLIILTAVVIFLSIIASWKIQKNLKFYLSMILLLETGVLGTFLAIDFFLFYVFYEIMLIPMYFLIGLWGGARRKYAALKFFIYTQTGGVLILIAMIFCYSTDLQDFVDSNIVKAKKEDLKKTALDVENKKLSDTEALARVEVHTFDLAIISRAGQAAAVRLFGKEDFLSPWKPLADQRLEKERFHLLGPGVSLEEAKKRFHQPFFRPAYQYLLFALLFIGFAVKVPTVPLHSWLPDAHVEAPTPVSMILAGILLKLGGYGLLRLAYPICPFAAEQLSFWVGLIGVSGIVWGAFVAMGQSDFKKMLAYSSVSHMGYVVLGIAAWSGGLGAKYWAMSVNGAIFQMVAHGISSAGMFFVVGVICDRAHHRDLNRFGGIWGMMPLYGGLSAILFFASMGLPGLCGFVGEFCIMMGSWQFHPGFAIAAILITIITASYLLWTWQRVFMGTKKFEALYPDVSLREAIVLLCFVVLAIALGVYPNLMFSWSEPSAINLVESLSRLK
ncbi:NADH-quinone oxidoreductase subunit M [Telmatocola sphagniphila]|uniref:NADH-quinone oxidoreductase subunit M n=1 Tax=Telmatocola sphagniphila TaxID=1123043 RepID=A0A8E6BA75_9BACT|nr:NADH-quinone oxidoreductase subunit M [Telmatocola sphagniphila]QVL33245.1 NADH-quinone oxidoreductase subunit M [Telmatocola sphagniphila]